jgi:outer membrane protein|tara:strand:- start:1774 stop:2307 length:534 start_codon:yes stop_codon:yes gene_type:complete
MINIQYFKTVILTVFVLLIFTQSKSAVKIAIIDTEVIMKESLAGKSLIKQLSKIDDSNKKYFLEYEKKLKLEKEKISSQINILSKEEYDKKVLILNEDFKKYQNEVRDKLELTKSKRDKALKKILSELNVLLSNYSNENELTFIIDQKNIIIGRTDLNVTSEILKLIDLKLKKVSLN